MENIYWGLVSAYEDEQAKERALAQSTQLSEDNRKQLQIGTLAPLDVVNSDSAVATDKQALMASQSNLEYQQLMMKQAIARNLDDPQLGQCAGGPDRPRGAGPAAGRGHGGGGPGAAGVCQQSADGAGRAEMKNNEITIKAEKNGLLPTVDAYAFYGASARGRAVRTRTALNCSTGAICPAMSSPKRLRATAVEQSLNNSSPDKGVGVNITIPLRNRDGAGRPGAVADGVPAGADAAAAALHADAHPGDQRAVCFDQ